MKVHVDAVDLIDCWTSSSAASPRTRNSNLLQGRSQWL